MPTYEYKCEDCSYTFEEFQNMRDKPIEKCQKCEGRVRRLISGGGGIIFRGSSFHATNYTNSSSPACGRDRPCCGRDTPCDKRPCES